MTCIRAKEGWVCLDIEAGLRAELREALDSPVGSLWYDESKTPSGIWKKTENGWVECEWKLVKKEKNNDRATN